MRQAARSPDPHTRTVLPLGATRTPIATLSSVRSQACPRTPVRRGIGRASRAFRRAGNEDDAKQSCIYGNLFLSSRTGVVADTLQHTPHEGEECARGSMRGERIL